MTPTGASCGANAERTKVSTQMRKIAPPNADSGNSIRCVCPASNLTTCGTRRPMNPIAPDAATAAAVISAVRIIKVTLVRVTLMPREAAVSQPKVIVG